MSFQKLLACVFLLSLSLGVQALESPGINVEKGEGYETIDPPQPTEDSTKVEVIEFFWYGCPHCYKFEPILQKWRKTSPEYVSYISQPTAFNSMWAKHARAYYIAEALGVIDKMHEDFFNAIQIDKKRLDKQDVLADFFVAHGVSKKDFNDTYSSFLVEVKTKQAESIAKRYGVNGVPAIVVNGKYRVSSTTAKSHENMITVMDYLIKKEHAAMAKTTAVKP
jgi:thiol:disulfide interchange protein DsbA